VRDPVTIVAAGVVTPIGQDLDAFWSSLLTGGAGITRIERFPVADLGVGLGGEIKKLPPAPRRAPECRASRLLLAAASELRSGGGALLARDPARLAVVVGTALGGVAEGERALAGAAGLRTLAGALYDSPARNLARGLGARGPVLTVSTACASGATALGVGAELVRDGVADVVVAGGYDVLCRFVMKGFDVLRALTRDDLMRYLEEHYLLRNLVVTIAGPVTHEEAIGLIEPYLKVRGNGAAPPSFLPSVGNGLKPTVLLKAKKTEQAHVCLGVHAPSYMDRDRHVIDILNCVLGEGMSSRLFLEVREKLGLAYDVHSYVNKMYDTGVLGIYAGTEPRQAARAVGAIVGQLRRLCDEPVNRAELTKAKEFYKGRLLLQMESTNSVATWYGGQEALTGRIEDVDETVAEIDAVTADDVMRVGKELFGQALQLAVIGPFRSEAPFLKQIA